MEADADLRHLSCGLYQIVSHEIGSEEAIMLRRRMGKVEEELDRIQNGRGRYDFLKSGSRAEGFTFSTSDTDIMVVYKYVHVKMDNKRRQLEYKTIVKTETDQTRPGFCLIRLLSQGRRIYFDVNQACVNFQNGRYLSNIKWKDRTKCFIENPIIHGPCESGIHGGVEFDVAHCLRCSKWPKSTYPFLQRLVRRGWPSLQVLLRIIKNGCHIVPIGDKSSDKEEIEWRLSFSEAEKTLIHEMNHCQFLTYGLLKIFLKEAINTRQDVGDLLCSYFLKTVVLWEIYNNGEQWMERDFIKWFWICFRRLLSWVSNGYCPNFFIPENNMFLGKIHGRLQEYLLRHLTSFYRIGYKCLLGCKSIYLQYLPLLGHPIAKEICSCDLDRSKVTEMELIRQIFLTMVCLHDISCMSRASKLLRHILTQNESSDTHFVTCIKTLLHYYTQQWLYHSASKSIFPLIASRNRNSYGMSTRYINTLKRMKCDRSSHAILSAMILYKQGMYHHVIRKANLIRQCILDPSVMYVWDLSHFQYYHVGGNHTPLDIIMRKFIVFESTFGKKVGLPELKLEHGSTDQGIPYPPIVLLYFLLFMSYYHLHMFSEANCELENLTALMNLDDGHYVNKKHRAISWEILGISQEIAGCFHDAYLSFQNALKDPFNNHFREVTLLRLQNLAPCINQT